MGASCVCGFSAPSIYERLGGQQIVTTITRMFYSKIMADERINYIFKDMKIDWDRQFDHQFQFLRLAFGGPDSNTDIDIRAAHANVNNGKFPDETHFCAFLDNLISTLKSLYIPQPDMEEIVSIILAYRNDVLGLDEESGNSDQWRKKYITLIEKYPVIPQQNALFDEWSDTDVGKRRGRVASIPNLRKEFNATESLANTPSVNLRKEFNATDSSSTTSSRKGLFRDMKRASVGGAWWAHNDRTHSSRSKSFSSQRYCASSSSSKSSFRHPPWTESSCDTETPSPVKWPARDEDGTTLGNLEKGLQVRANVLSRNLKFHSVRKSCSSALKFPVHEYSSNKRKVAFDEYSDCS